MCRCRNAGYAMGVLQGYLTICTCGIFRRMAINLKGSKSSCLICKLTHWGRVPQNNPALVGANPFPKPMVTTYYLESGEQS